MTIRRTVVVVAALITVASGCGGEDGVSPTADDAAISTTTSVVAGTPADEAPGPSSPTTPPDTAPPDTAAPTTAAPTTDEVAGGGADCLNGLWFANAEELQRRIDSYRIPVEILVEPISSSTLTMSDGTFVANTSVALTGQLPIGEGVELTAAGTSHIEGTYTIDGGTVTTTITIDTSEIGDWVAVVGGETIALPAAEALGEPPVPGGDFGGGQFTCTDTTLTFNVPGSEYGSITFIREA